MRLVTEKYGGTITCASKLGGGTMAVIYCSAFGDLKFSVNI